MITARIEDPELQVLMARVREIEVQLDEARSDFIRAWSNIENNKVHQVATSANNELHDALRKWTIESLTTEKVDPFYVSEVLDVIRYLDQYDRDYSNDQGADK